VQVHPQFTIVRSFFFFIRSIQQIFFKERLVPHRCKFLCHLSWHGTHEVTTIVLKERKKHQRKEGIYRALNLDHWHVKADEHHYTIPSPMGPYKGRNTTHSFAFSPFARWDGKPALLGGIPPDPRARFARSPSCVLIPSRFLLLKNLWVCFLSLGWPSRRKPYEGAIRQRPFCLRLSLLKNRKTPRLLN